MVDVVIFEDIATKTATRVQQELARLNGRRDIVVRINSPGGDPYAAVALCHMIRRAGARTIVEGVAASAASLLFVAGRERIFPETSRIMMHLSAVQVEGNAATLKSGAEMLSSIDRQMATLYSSCSRGRLTFERAMELMVAETWLDAAGAVALGLADVAAEALAAVAQTGTASASIFQKPSEAPALAQKIERVVPGRAPRAEHTVKIA